MKLDSSCAMTSKECRALWRALKFRYADIEPYDLDALQGYIAIECAESSRKGETPRYCRRRSAFNACRSRVLRWICSRSVCYVDSDSRRNLDFKSADFNSRIRRQPIRNFFGHERFVCRVCAQGADSNHARSVWSLWHGGDGRFPRDGSIARREARLDRHGEALRLANRSRRFARRQVFVQSLSPNRLVPVRYERRETQSDNGNPLHECRGHVAL